LTGVNELTVWLLAFNHNLLPLNDAANGLYLDLFLELFESNLAI